jgi:serine/threonine protein kinase
VLDFVKVLDFGLVRAESQSQDMALTSAASLTGTPLYMSPESVESPEKISVRSDVYQLGAIAYYLLAGRHVFPGDSLVDVLAKHMSEAPEPLARVRGSAVDPSLEAIVLRCLAKRPEDRPADAGELLELLEQCAVEGAWGQREARGWWAVWRDAHPDDLDAEGTTASTMPSAYSIDLKGRLGPKAERRGA